jgi:hypothetical protein
MGDANMCTSGFVALEAGYVWNNIGGYDFTIVGTGTTLTSTTTKQQYGGRFAAGVMNVMDEEFGFTGELGWGYFGKTTLAPIATGVAATIPADLTISHTLSGFDALIGVAFVQPYYSLFLKGGALIQNMSTSTTAFFDPLALPLVSTMNLKSNQTAVLPEVKVGAAYNFNPNWALTASYLYAFGGSPSAFGSFNPITSTAILNVNTLNPSVSAFLIGVQYTA